MKKSTNVPNYVQISTIRKDDFDFVRDKSGEFVDILQCNNAASSRTPRGHQFPAAFMIAVRKHREKKLKDGGVRYMLGYFFLWRNCKKNRI